MKVGIITINDCTNYGNRLQNYALTTLLLQQGMDVLNGIQVYTREEWISNSQDRTSRWIKKCIPFQFYRYRMKKSIERTKQKFQNDFLLIERKKKLEDFTDSYTSIILPIIASTKRKAYEECQKYGIDVFIIGSDQVWNPSCAAQGYYFADFAPKNKRLSFSASFGISEIPKENKKFISSNLSDMALISVREKSAACLVRELTGKKAVHTLDPTLLVENTLWENVVAKSTFNIETGYVCTYFLGDIPQSVLEYCKSNNLRIVSLNDRNEKEYFSLGVEDFLYVIKNADLVITDSFHALAMSIRFHVQFLVYERRQSDMLDMFSRLKDLLSEIGLENRIRQDKVFADEIISNAKWKEIDDFLLVHRDEAIQLLLKYIEVDR